MLKKVKSFKKNNFYFFHIIFKEMKLKCSRCCNMILKFIQSWRHKNIKSIDGFIFLSSSWYVMVPLCKQLIDFLDFSIDTGKPKATLTISSLVGVSICYIDHLGCSVKWRKYFNWDLLISHVTSPFPTYNKCTVDCFINIKTKILKTSSNENII